MITPIWSKLPPELVMLPLPDNTLTPTVTPAVSNTLLVPLIFDLRVPTPVVKNPLLPIARPLWLTVVSPPRAHGPSPSVKVPAPVFDQIGVIIGNNDQTSSYGGQIQKGTAKN